MDIGKLDKRCLIQRKVVTQDDVYGTEIITWTTVASMWCNVVDSAPSRDESIRQGMSMTASRSRFRFRFRSDIDTSMRIIILRPVETVYQIIGGPAEIGNRDGIEIMCEKVTT